MTNSIKRSLRSQFLIRILLVLIITASISGLIQISYIKKQIVTGTDNQAMLIAKSVDNGITETLLATKAIEQQIDLRLISQADHISDLLGGAGLNNISMQDLIQIRDQLGLAGITVLGAQNDDIQAIVSTEPAEVGFSLKEIGFLDAAQILLDGGKAVIPGATFIDNGIAVLPIAQSATHSDKPVFYKYAYFHPPGADFVVSAYIESGEIYQFTNETGPESWISKMKKEDSTIIEMGILTPKVFVDPELEEKIYPPIKKVVHGSFDMQSDKDTNILKAMVEQPEKVAFIEELNGNKIYKMFLPINDNEVMYLSLDYDRLSAPLIKHSFILILSGFISLIALFMLTVNFFNKIYRDIQQISKQIHMLEARDFTARSEISDRGEMGSLSESTNRMAMALNDVLQRTIEQATKIKQSSMLLEEDAHLSVERVYALSMENTAITRDSTDELYNFLQEIERYLESVEPNPTASSISQKVGILRELVQDQSQSTTEITITLSDLLQSLHDQSKELAGISRVLHEQMAQFKLREIEE